MQQENDSLLTIQKWRDKAVSQLQEVTNVPHLEADYLLNYVLSYSRTYLFTHMSEILTESASIQLNALLLRRLQREPLAYILGTTEFWSLPLKMTPDALVPRPETEILVEAVLQRLDHIAVNRQDAADFISVADLGTGSGSIALALAKERPDWKIVATDISPSALNLAKENAQCLNLQNVTFYLGDWCKGLPSQLFHAIVSNPPYLSEQDWKNSPRELHFEPKSALLADSDGLASFISITQEAKSFLHLGGYLAFEHGAFQGAAVRDILLKQGFIHIQTECDLAGYERITLGQWLPV